MAIDICSRLPGTLNRDFSAALKAVQNSFNRLKKDNNLVKKHIHPGNRLEPTMEKVIPRVQRLIELYQHSNGNVKVPAIQAATKEAHSWLEALLIATAPS